MNNICPVQLEFCLFAWCALACAWAMLTHILYYDGRVGAPWIVVSLLFFLGVAWCICRLIADERPRRPRAATH